MGRDFKVMSDVDILLKAFQKCFIDYVAFSDSANYDKILSIKV